MANRECRNYPRRPFQQPAWDGSALGGRTILLHAEMGLGDTIQFVRYAPLVKDRGGRVVVEAQAALVRLLRGRPGSINWWPATRLCRTSTCMLPC